MKLDGIYLKTLVLCISRLGNDSSRVLRLEYFLHYDFPLRKKKGQMENNMTLFFLSRLE